MIFVVVLVGLICCEKKPPITWKTCTQSSCTNKQGYIVSDVAWRSPETADIDYEKQLGVSTNGSSLIQKFVTGDNVGSQLYLLQNDEKNYEMFTFINKEFTFDLDISELPCGLNAALYGVEMPQQGTGVGAEYGTGYCDANFLGDNNKLGCGEIDIWEGNSQAEVLITHPCSRLGQFTKSQGSCHSDGCGYNPYKCDKQFYGKSPNFKVDSSKEFTVVTQFIGSGTTLKEIRRLYVQNGKVIQNAKCNNSQFESLSDDFCLAYGASSTYTLNQLAKSLAAGHVLVFALWDSYDMGWLDAYDAGPCPGGDTENKEYLEKNYPNIKVTWSNIRYGDIDSTY
jgi:hypothetical protein